MSFKDKPLKKIVADTRITIDAIHNGIISDFSNNKILLCEKEKKLDLLIQENENNPEVKSIKGEIKKLKLKKKDEIDYYLDTTGLLNEYYSRKEGNIIEGDK